MADNRKYYYLKLKENFFDSVNISRYEGHRYAFEIHQYT